MGTLFDIVVQVQQSTIFYEKEEKRNRIDFVLLEIRI